MSAHTPGPWNIEEPLAEKVPFRIGTNLTAIAHVFLEPNARLIAAAPALLEALEASVYVIERLPTSLGYDFDVLKQARAAIRAAKGENNG